MSQLRNLVENKVLLSRLGSGSAVGKFRRDRRAHPARVRRIVEEIKAQRVLSTAQARTREEAKRQAQPKPGLLRRFVAAVRKAFSPK